METLTLSQQDLDTLKALRAEGHDLNELAEMEFKVYAFQHRKDKTTTIEVGSLANTNISATLRKVIIQDQLEHLLRMIGDAEIVELKYIPNDKFEGEIYETFKATVL